MEEGKCTEKDLLEMVEADIEDGDGIDLNQRDASSWSPLHWAASDGLPDLCKKLIEYKVLPNAGCAHCLALWCNEDSLMALQDSAHALRGL